MAVRAAPARSWIMPTVLADQLNSMAAAAASATADATEASAKLNEAGQKARRKSRDLEAQFFGMHVEEVADIKKIFEEFDEDHSGGISLEELKKAIKSLKATICPEDRVVRATAGHLSLCPVPYAGTQRAHVSLIFAVRSPPLLVPPSVSCVCCPPPPAARRSFANRSQSTRGRISRTARSWMRMRSAS